MGETQAQLITFPPSLDCETGRWLVDHHGLQYEERAHAVPFIALAVKWHGGAGIPVLVDGAQTVGKPAAIHEYLEERALPAKQLAVSPAATEAAWRDYNLEFGEATALWAYTYLLPQSKLTLAMLTRGCGRFQRLFNTILYPLIAMALRKGLGITPDNTQAAVRTIRSYFDRIDSLLEDGRPYLEGDRFSIVDLVTAVAAAPLILPPEYRGGLPSIQELPEAMVPLIKECRARRAGKYVQRIYEQHR